MKAFPSQYRRGYDGGHIAAEVNSSGQMLRRTVWGPGSDDPVVWYEGSGTTDRRYMPAVDLGSIINDARGSRLRVCGPAALKSILPRSHYLQEPKTK